MELIKIGKFIQELRKEKNITQEDLADKFYVSRRTVSRWETGANLPDIDILIDLADYFEVDLREILNGKRKEDKMNLEEKELSKEVSAYTKARLKRTSIITLVILIYAVIVLITGVIIEEIGIENQHVANFIKGFCFGTAFGAIILAIFYVTGLFDKFAKAKYNFFHKNK